MKCNSCTPVIQLLGGVETASPLLIWSATLSARLKKTTMDPDDLNSYRPISNLSFACKLVEPSVAARFVKHCDQNHLFPVRQSAFSRHHSTETAVLIVHNDIRAIDNGQLTVLLFLDLSSAIDIMLSILHLRFSIDGAALNWFHSYLTDPNEMQFANSYGILQHQWTNLGSE